MSQPPLAIVSAILISGQEGKRKVFLQTRWKPDSSPAYSGMVEIPAGGIDPYENVYDALKREVKEECGLDIIRVLDDYHGPVLQPRAGDRAFVFQPFICQQVLETDGGLPWIGFAFVCEVTGEVRLNPDEAKDPRWVSVGELRQIVEQTPETVFPLQLPALKHFVEQVDSGTMKI